MKENARKRRDERDDLSHGRPRSIVGWSRLSAGVAHFIGPAVKLDRAEETLANRIFKYFAVRGSNVPQRDLSASRGIMPAVGSQCFASLSGDLLGPAVRRIASRRPGNRLQGFPAVLRTGGVFLGQAGGSAALPGLKVRIMSPALAAPLAGSQAMAPSWSNSPGPTP